MGKQIYEKTKGITKVISICILLLLFLATTAYAQDTKSDSITMLNNPPGVTDPASFKFIVFGDTRTNGTSTDSDSIAFHKIRDMVITDVVAQLTTGESSQSPQFAFFTADAIYQGSDPKYWDELKALIPEDLRTSPGKIFSVLGNHELWQVQGQGDPEDLYFQAYPNLVQDKNRLHNYAFRIGTNLFVSLCSGGYDAGKSDPQNDVIWNCNVINSFQGLMNSLQTLIQDQYNSNKIDKVFIQYHKPSFSNYQHPALEYDYNPYNFLSQFINTTMKDKGIRTFIFNGHNHTTEFYEPEKNIWALVAGGGGAPQKLMTSFIPRQEGNELFWKTLGLDPNNRQRRANYFIVNVSQNQVQIQEMALCYINDGGSSDFKFVEGVTINDSGTITPPAALNIDSYMKNIPIPIRPYIEDRGGTVMWNEVDDGTRQKVIFWLKNSALVELWIGSTETVVGGKTIRIEVPPQVIEGRTVLPLYVIENLINKLQ